MTQIAHLIGGIDVVGEGKTLEVYNPATSEVIEELPEASPEQVEVAVEAARNSFDQGGWANRSTAKRSEVLRRAAQAIRDEAETLCEIQIVESGMLPDTVRIQIASAAGWFEYYADFLTSEHGEVFRQLGSATTLVERVPVGVCALFSPWNVPVGLSAIKLAPALAAGNSVVLKPSEETPRVVRHLVDLVNSAGLPAGVLNCVNGSGTVTGAALARAPGIDMISYTGGQAGGRAVAEAAARRFLPCVMELGGKSATIVFADADQNAALDGALRAIYGSNGEACLAGSRILVEKSIAESFFERFKSLAEAIVVGDPKVKGVGIGPMISAEHRARILEYYEKAVADGDEVLFGGAADTCGQGYFVRPGGIRVASTLSRTWKEEIFGPLAAFKTFSDENEAIRLANDSAFGLAGYLWTQDINRAMRVARAIRTGTVVVNAAFMRERNAPFGGFKQSGFGREGGVHSWQNFTEAKATVIHHG